MNPLENEDLSGTLWWSHQLSNCFVRVNLLDMTDWKQFQMVKLSLYKIVRGFTPIFLEGESSAETSECFWSPILGRIDWTEHAWCRLCLNGAWMWWNWCCTFYLDTLSGYITLTWRQTRIGGHSGINCQCKSFIDGLLCLVHRSIWKK